MSRLSQRQAAKEWGVGRITIQRAIKDGKLTADADGRLDPADLLRVLGEPRGTAGDRPDEPSRTTPEPGVHEVEIARLRAELEAAHALLAAKDATISAKDETIAALRLLTHEQPATTPAKPSRRWWQW